MQSQTKLIIPAHLVPALMRAHRPSHYRDIPVDLNTSPLHIYVRCKWRTDTRTCCSGPAIIERSVIFPSSLLSLFREPGARPSYRLTCAGTAVGFSILARTDPMYITTGDVVLTVLLSQQSGPECTCSSAGAGVIVLEQVSKTFSGTPCISTAGGARPASLASLAVIQGHMLSTDMFTVL